MTEAELDRQICDAFFRQLETETLASMTPETLAELAGCEVQAVIARGADAEQLACFVMEVLDRQALAESATDFSDAEDASVYEKILEGLIHRFEVLAPYRAGFEKLHQSCFMRPALGVKLALQLQTTIDRLLMLSGDDSAGIVRAARIKGVFAVLMRVRKTWIKDDTPDLSQTLNALDKSLRDAQEWALSLRVLSAQDAHQE